MKKQTIRVQLVDDNGAAIGLPDIFQGREGWTLQKLMTAKEDALMRRAMVISFSDGNKKGGQRTPCSTNRRFSYRP